MQSPEIDYEALQNPAIKYYETEGCNSPLSYTNKQIEMINSKYNNQHSSRPQTTVGGNFTSNVGIN